jgi:uroporphyrinogen decarboxylase
MTENSSKALLLEASGKRAHHTPLWLMRQAGRYLPEYMAIRAKHDTLTMFKTPAIAADITLQPLRRFALDAAIIYADILLIPDALGLGLEFVAGEGPRFKKTIRNESNLAWLKTQFTDVASIVERLSYVMEALEIVKGKLPQGVTLIGFAGAPWTVASYIIEGGSAQGEFLESKKLMFHAPEVLHGILEIVTEISIAYLHAQVKAGAEIVQLFESWGGALTPSQYETFAAPYAQRILDAMKGHVPTIHFVGESAGILNEVLKVKSDVFGVDWRQDLERVKGVVAPLGRCLQGNLDPLLMLAPQATIAKNLEPILRAGRSYEHGYIFNLGHGINRTTPVENVEFVVNFVHSFKG